jgi:hypothetical protein
MTRSEGGSRAGSRKALITIGTAAHARFTELTRPVLEEYASRHGYELSIVNHTPLYIRFANQVRLGWGPSWYKVPVLRRLLETHDVAVCIDADATFVDLSFDVAELVVPGRSIYMTQHNYDGNETINCGFMMYVANERSRRFLAEVWRYRRRYAYDPIYENAVVLDLFGYTNERPYRKVRDSEWDADFEPLGLEWNSIPWDEHPSPRVRHYAGIPYPERLGRLQEDVALVLGQS